MNTLTIEVSDELTARLREASEREHVPPAQIVQEVLDRLLPTTEELRPPGGSLADKMKDAIGCFDSGLTDLATNPKYMEGYGEWRREGAKNTAAAAAPTPPPTPSQRTSRRIRHALAPKT